jgi:membrane-bound ClpP family serine protease
MNTEVSNRPNPSGKTVRVAEDPRSDSIPGLLRTLATDLSTLLGKELALAKAEVREASEEIKTSIASLATGASIALAGLVILLMAAVYGLSEFMEPWLSALIVGGIAVIIGFMMIKAAQKKMQASTLAPTRTVDALQKDKETAKRAFQ